MKNILLCLVQISIASLIDFANWKSLYEKSYSTNHLENVHYKIWKRKYKLVTKHNKNLSRKFDMEMNAFADQRYVGENFNSGRTSQCPTSNFTVSTFPKNVDYRKSGCVGPVRNQAQCPQFRI